MNVVIAILIFASLIIVHEFGHFVAAKRVGIQVDEFAIGIGPVLFDVQRGETTYSWRLFPVLGFVRMAGTDLEDEALPGRGFRDKTVWQRKAVIAAGPAMNYLMAVLAFTVLFAWVGIPVADPASTVIGETLPNYPAQQAGLRAGDRIIFVAGEPVHSWNEMVAAFDQYAGQEINVVVERDGAELSVTLVPTNNPDTGSGGFIGVRPEITSEKYGFWKGLGLGMGRTLGMTVAWFEGMAMVVTRQLEADLTGPVGIASMLSRAVTLGPGYLLHLTGALNAVIAIINFLPLPALDGSRLAFLALEAVRGRPVDPQREGIIHFVGLMTLLFLSLIVLYWDILRLGL